MAAARALGSAPESSEAATDGAPHGGPAGGEPDECSKDFCSTFCGLA